MTSSAAPAFFPAIVIGAGISGLACAYTLRQRGIDAQLFEASERAGGVIRSVARDGFIFELGPQSFSLTEPLRKLSRELRIESQLLLAPAKLPRYLLLDGQLLPAPLSPPAFITSSLFSRRTKLSVLRDAFGHSKPPADTTAGGESVAHFIRRKFGDELLEKLIGPFVSGIYAGDPEKLELRSAFPQLYAAENAHGSVIRGLLRAKRRGHKAPTLATFEHGNQTLGDSLASNLGPALHLGVAATIVTVSPFGARGRFLVHFAKSQEPSAPANSVYADHVIIATPASAAGKLLGNLDEALPRLLGGVEYAPVAVVSLGYRRTAITNSLRGFGLLAPRSSRLRILGCVWNSSLSPGRAPEAAVLVTTFVGGAFDKAACQLPAAELESIVHQELRRILGISEAPIGSNAQVWSHAIPQYDLGHYRRAQTLQQKLAAFPGLVLAGNYFDGPAVGAVVDRAIRIADYVLDGPAR